MKDKQINIRISVDAIEDAIENRRIAGQPPDMGLKVALNLIKQGQKDRG